MAAKQQKRSIPVQIKAMAEDGSFEATSQSTTKLTWAAT